MLIQKIIKKQEKFFFYIFLLTTFLGYSFLVIRNHDQFQTFAWDLGFFDQLLWKASKFTYSYSTIGDLTILGDHFQPILFFMIPLYWLWSNVKAILIAQAFLVVSAALPLYFLSYKILKTKLASWAIAISYLFFTATQFTVTNEFHQSAFIPLFLNCLFLFVFQKRWLYYWFMVIGLILTREEMGLLVSSIGIMLILKKATRQIGMLTFFIGLISFFLSVYYLIPLFNPQKIYPHFGYGIVGETPTQVIINFFKQPKIFLSSLIFPTIKIKTVFSSFFSFAFLPIFSPIFLIPICQQFIVRFLDSITIHRWVNLNHYAIPLSSLMAVASIYGISNLHKLLKNLDICFKKNIEFLSLALIFFTGLQNFLFHGPINSLTKKQLFETQPWMLDNYNVKKKIPEKAAVAAQNSLVPHISHREKTYLLPKINDADFLWVDLADGPNKYAPLNHQEINNLIQELIKKGEYQIYYQQGKSLLFKRK